MTFSPRVPGGRKSGSRGMFVALLVGVIALHIVAQPLAACEIPVFRYALERWNPDNYQVLVLHRQSMTAEQRALVAKLQQAASDPAHPANLEVIPIDLAAKSDDPTIKLLQKQHETLAAPLLALRQPHTQPDAKPIWTAPLSAENIERLVDSPARKEIISRLTSGQSAVWVMLETGNAQQDDAAAATLEKELARLAKELKLPEKDVLEADEFFKPETKVPLQVSF